ncbi:MAG: hypothetical protein ACYDDA_03665 [Acidiferrobacteraceae bacterium]
MHAVRIPVDRDPDVPLLELRIQELGFAFSDVLKHLSRLKAFERFNVSQLIVTRCTAAIIAPPVSAAEGPVSPCATSIWASRKYANTQGNTVSIHRESRWLRESIDPPVHKVLRARVRVIREPGTT